MTPEHIRGINYFLDSEKFRIVGTPKRGLPIWLVDIRLFRQPLIPLASKQKQTHTSLT